MYPRTTVMIDGRKMNLLIWDFSMCTLQLTTTIFAIILMNLDYIKFQSHLSCKLLLLLEPVF